MYIIILFFLLASLLQFSTSTEKVTKNIVPPRFESGICFYGDAAKRILNWLSSDKDVDGLIPSVPKPRDCSSLDTKHDKSGIYKVYPDKKEGFRVYCDMETDGGGWTVLIRRMDGSQSFVQWWKEYENGFGDLKREFWLGNIYIHRLTSNGRTELRVDLENFNKEKRYAKYAIFSVGDAASKYTLSVGTYAGTAGDSLQYHNGRQFSTADKDNDAYNGNCASGGERMGSGWWYGACESASFTLHYAVNNKGKAGEQLNQWENWQHSAYALKYASMMIRRV